MPRWRPEVIHHTKRKKTGTKAKATLELECSEPHIVFVCFHEIIQGLDSMSEIVNIVSFLLQQKYKNSCCSMNGCPWFKASENHVTPSTRDKILFRNHPKNGKKTYDGFKSCCPVHFPNFYHLVIQKKSVCKWGARLLVMYIHKEHIIELLATSLHSTSFWFKATLNIYHDIQILTRRVQL